MLDCCNGELRRVERTRSSEARADHFHDLDCEALLGLAQGHLHFFEDDAVKEVALDGGIVADEHAEEDPHRPKGGGFGLIRRGVKDLERLRNAGQPQRSWTTEAGRRGTDLNLEALPELGLMRLRIVPAKDWQACLNRAERVDLHLAAAARELLEQDRHSLAGEERAPGEARPERRPQILGRDTVRIARGWPVRDGKVAVGDVKELLDGRVDVELENDDLGERERDQQVARILLAVSDLRAVRLNEAIWAETDESCKSETTVRLAGRCVRSKINRCLAHAPGLWRCMSVSIVRKTR